MQNAYFAHVVQATFTIDILLFLSDLLPFRKNQRMQLKLLCYIKNIFHFLQGIYKNIQTSELLFQTDSQSI